MKDHCKFCPEIGALSAKYPWIQDPSVLVDNSKEALAYQVQQEKRQIKSFRRFLYGHHCLQCEPRRHTARPSHSSEQYFESQD